MRKLPIVLALLSSIAAAAGHAEPVTQGSMTTIAPIFSQLVVFSLPAGFTTVNEQSNDRQYIREAVLKGETVDRWSEMITVTGAKGLAADPQMSAQYFAAQIAGGFQKACPNTFSVKPMGDVKISEHDAFVAVASCGKVDSSADKHSETALILAIKGAQDVYTIQWAVRAPSSAENLTIDEAIWKGRLEKLAPIRVCSIVPGEKAPYPSCVNQH
jgi:hypothetical protein